MFGEMTTPTSPKSEIFCNNQEQEKFLPDHGIESSLALDLHPGRTLNSCKRYFTAPESTGFIIKLVRLQAAADAADDDNATNSNATSSDFCPISIVSNKTLATKVIHSLDNQLHAQKFSH